MNLYEDSLIIITSDHGESFEHGYYFDHGDRLYEGLIRVPLMIKFPKLKWKGKLINEQVEIIDIAPTIMDYLSLKPLQNIDGKSLMALISGQADGFNKKYSKKHLPMINNDKLKFQDYAYSQTPYRESFYFKAAELHSLRTNQLKFLKNQRSNQVELYNIFDDPKEKTDLSTKEPAELKKFEMVLTEFNSLFKKQTGIKKKIELDKNTEETLKSLGYIK